MIKLLLLLWHEARCPIAKSGESVVVHTNAGRIYECDCGYSLMEVYTP